MTATDEGWIRIYATNAADLYKDILFESRTEILDASLDLDKQIHVLAQKYSVPEDCKIVFSMKADAATSINNTSKILIPCRIMDTNRKVARDTTLTAGDFGLTSTNVAVGTDWTKVGERVVRAQEVIRIGQSNYDNSRIYIALNFT